MKKHFFNKNIAFGFILATVFGLFVYGYGIKDMKEKAYVAFKEDTEASRKDITREFDKYVRFLEGLKAFVTTHPNLTEEELNRYFAAVNVDKSYSALIYLGYTELSGVNRSREIYYFNNSKYNMPEQNLEYDTNLNKRKISLQTNKEGKIFWSLEYKMPLVIDNKMKEIVAIMNFDDILSAHISDSLKFSKLGYIVPNESQDYSFIKRKFLLFQEEREKFVNHFILTLNNDNYDILLYAKDPKKYYNSEELIIALSIGGGVLVFSLLLLYNTLWSAKLLAKRIAEKATEDLTKMAWHDSLTNLFNRAKCLSNIEQRINNKGDKEFYLFFIDLDGFKRVNDTLGHHAGDIILCEYARRLKRILPASHMISRVGGDEFVVLIDKERGVAQEIQGWAKIIKEATAHLFLIDNYKFALSQSIGVATYPEHGKTNEVLLKNADIAMYIAKKSDSHDYVIYSEDVGNQLIERNKMESDLIETIKNQELYVMFQPKMRKENSGYRMVGMEALMRWNSPVWGEVGPDKFIPIAEQNGFIENMSTWLLETVCEKLKKWKSSVGMTIPISINLSGKQFLNPKLADELLEIIKKYEVDTSSIIIEITESTIMKQPETAKKIISVLRYYGVKVSMDDFGTGYSSFSYLSRFMIDELKIDKSFVRRTKKSSMDRSVVEAIVSMGLKLNLNVIAEGVETLEEIVFLSSVGCTNYQGYFFSRPLREEALLEFYLKNNKSLNA